MPSKLILSPSFGTMRAGMVRERQFDVGAFLVDVVHTGREFQLGGSCTDHLYLSHLQILAFESPQTFS